MWYTKVFNSVLESGVVIIMGVIMVLLLVMALILKLDDILRFIGHKLWYITHKT